MKFKLPIGVCILISLALVLFGVFFGVMSGFNDDRAQVTALLEGDNGLLDALYYRGADGLNLCAVARRHLSNDADVAALEAAAAKLRDEQEGIAAKKLENDKLDAAVAAVADKLAAQSSFQGSERDQKYLTMLKSDMDALQKGAHIDTYNRDAKAFNDKLAEPVLGFVARLAGVAPCELYE